AALSVERRSVLARFYEAAGDRRMLRLSPYTRNRAAAGRWLEPAGGALDRVIAQRLPDPYQPGEAATLQVKRRRTADCVVGGFRYAQGSRLVGSLLLGL